jgi:hypothetical protein
MDLHTYDMHGIGVRIGFALLTGNLVVGTTYQEIDTQQASKKKPPTHRKLFPLNPCLYASGYLLQVNYGSGLAC